jgi:hypothetical protein
LGGEGEEKERNEGAHGTKFFGTGFTRFKD